MWPNQGLWDKGSIINQVLHHFMHSSTVSHLGNILHLVAERRKKDSAAPQLDQVTLEWVVVWGFFLSRDPLIPILHLKKKKKKHIFWFSASFWTH